MYDAQYIRELTAARKANEVARALIKDHEATIVAQRAELEIERQRSERAERWVKECQCEWDALLSEANALRAEVARLRAALTNTPAE